MNVKDLDNFLRILPEITPGGRFEFLWGIGQREMEGFWRWLEREKPGRLTVNLNDSFLIFSPTFNTEHADILYQLWGEYLMKPENKELLKDLFKQLGSLTWEVKEDEGHWYKGSYEDDNWDDEDDTWDDGEERNALVIPEKYLASVEEVKKYLDK